MGLSGRWKEVDNHPSPRRMSYQHPLEKARQVGIQATCRAWKRAQHGKEVRRIARCYYGHVSAIPSLLSMALVQMVRLTSALTR